MHLPKEYKYDNRNRQLDGQRDPFFATLEPAQLFVPAEYPFQWQVCVFYDTFTSSWSNTALTVLMNKLYLALTRPQSITYRMPSIVTEVSAIFVLRTTFLVPEGGFAKASSC